MRRTVNNRCVEQHLNAHSFFGVVVVVVKLGCGTQEVMRTCTTIAHTHNTHKERMNLKRHKMGHLVSSEATTRVETTTNLSIINIEGELAVLQVEHLVLVVALIENAQARANVCTRCS